MAYRAAVCGASGYTGAELLRVLAGHPAVEVVVATADRNAGRAVGSLYASLGAAYPDLVCTPFDPAALAGLDVVFLALPHGASQRAMAQVIDTGARVVDLGADFRLPPDVYEQWYGTAHTAPGLYDRFVYGLPELFRSEIRDARGVAAPGCYPTAVSLACAPLVATHRHSGPIVANAVSGVSGAGRGAKVTSLFGEVNENVAPYGLLTHRHTAEMERNLSRVAGSPVPVLFTPHLVPMTRGILATCAIAGVEATTDDLLARYREYYDGEPFVRVIDDAPATKATYASNAVHVTVRADPRTGTVLAFGALDNLVKGASGQAVQCANLMLGIDEATGLTATGVMP